MCFFFNIKDIDRICNNHGIKWLYFISDELNISFCAVTLFFYIHAASGGGNIRSFYSR